MTYKHLTVIFLIAAVFSASDAASAQQTHTLKGNIVNQDGKAVEYVAVGIPGSGIGAISSADGRFRLEIPDGTADPLEFHHVSYLTGLVPASEYNGTDSLTVTLVPAELQEAVVLGSGAKEKTLVNKGARFPAAYGVYTPDMTGNEIGSTVKVRHRFQIKEFNFKVAFNTIEECKVSLNVYKITEGIFRNIMTVPLYIDIRTSARPVQYSAVPSATMILEPGEYFVSLAFVDCSDRSKAEWNEAKDLTGKAYMEKINENRLEFPLYFKSGFCRDTILGEIVKSPFNMGLTVSGLEYKDK